jgi:heptosyltransferase II
MKKLFDKIKNKLAYGLLVGIGRTLAALPQKWVECLSRGLGNVIYYSGLSRGAASNLTHAFPDRDPAWIRIATRISCQRLVELGLFALASPYISIKRIRKLIVIQSKADEFSDVKRPLIAVAPHFTNMEALTWVPTVVATPIPRASGIYRPFDNPALEEFVRKTRERGGTSLLSRKAGFTEAGKRLSNNEWLTILSDQNAGDKGTLTLFMDRLASTTELPGLLAERYDARIAVLWTERLGFWKTKIRGEIILEHTTHSTDVTLAANAWLEKRLREDSPAMAPFNAPVYNWLWMHNRWRTQDAPHKRFRIEAKRNALEDQLKSKTNPIPRRTPVCIRMPNWLGDVVMALPLIRAIRTARPDMNLSLLAKPAFLPLLQHLGIGDQYLPLPSSRGLSYLKDVVQYRSKYFETHLLFTNSTRSDLEAWIMGAPQRFGMRWLGKPRPLLSHSWKIPENWDLTVQHQTHLWHYFLQHFGLIEPIDYTPFKWPQKPYEKTRTVGLICGTENSPEKRWPIGHWRELIGAILDANPGTQIELMGTARDRALCESVASGFLSTWVKNWAGKTHLVEFTNRLSHCDIVVSNDTGGMHLANAIGTPIIGLYGPTNPVRTGPIFDGYKQVLQPPSCSRTGGALIEDLKPNVVIDALLKNFK